VAGQLGSGVLLDAVRGVRWPARRVSRGLLHGAHASIRTGSSPEFREYRPYRQGDDSTKIDWKLLGRTDRAAVRLAYDSSSLRTSILVDASASMAFPTRTIDKWQLTAAVALGLCAVAHGEGDPVGIAINSGEELRVLGPRTRRGTIADILRMLETASPTGSRPLAPALAVLERSHRVAILSDFLGDADALLGVAKILIAAGCEIYAVHVVAREELEPSAGDAVVTDPEDPTIRRHLHRGDVRRYQETFTEWREALAEAWRAAGAIYEFATTSDRADRIVRRITAPAGSAIEGR
jgi:uncharacterized protein (DUF58 family)